MLDRNYTRVNFVPMALLAMSIIQCVEFIHYKHAIKNPNWIGISQMLFDWNDAISGVAIMTCVPGCLYMI